VVYAGMWFSCWSLVWYFVVNDDLKFIFYYFHRIL